MFGESQSNELGERIIRSARSGDAEEVSRLAAIALQDDTAAIRDVLDYKVPSDLEHSSCTHNRDTYNGSNRIIITPVLFPIMPSHPIQSVVTIHKRIIFVLFIISIENGRICNESAGPGRSHCTALGRRSGPRRYC